MRERHTARKREWELRKVICSPPLSMCERACLCVRERGSEWVSVCVQGFRVILPFFCAWKQDLVWLAWRVQVSDSVFDTKRRIHWDLMVPSDCTFWAILTSDPFSVQWSLCSSVLHFQSIRASCLSRLEFPLKPWIKTMQPWLGPQTQLCNA